MLTTISRLIKKNHHTFNLKGCKFYISKKTVLLNPEAIENSGGILIVKPSIESAPDAAFFTAEINPSHDEEVDAEIAYRIKVDEPFGRLWVLPVFYFPGCIEQTASNRQAIHDAGCTWVHVEGE